MDFKGVPPEVASALSNCVSQFSVAIEMSSVLSSIGVFSCRLRGVPRSENLYRSGSRRKGGIPSARLPPRVLSRDHALALPDHPVIGPPQMRRGAAQRPPRFRQRRHLLCGRPRPQAEADFDGFLHGEIAGRPGVAVAEAKQEIDIGSPRTDAV